MKLPRRSWVIAGIAIAALVLAGWHAATAPPRPLPYAANSTEPEGAKALTLLLQHFGATVAVDDAPRGHVALLLQDTLDEHETRVVEGWVRDGGTLVVADPASSFAPEVTKAAERTDPVITKQCDQEDVADVGAIDVEGGAVASVYDVPANVDRCFPTAGGYFLAQGRFGQGRVIALGSPDPLTNRLLGSHDNSVLAVRLLHPERGDVVTVLRGAGRHLAGGDRTLADLVPGNVMAALWQLVVAGALVIAWRWRRFGRVVEEPLPVDIPSARLAVAVGELLQRSQHADDAAAALREDARRRLAERLGLDRHASFATVIDVACARRGIDRSSLSSLLVERRTTTSSELLALSRELDAVLQEVIDD